MSDEIELPEPVAYLNTDCIGERYLCFSAPTGGVTENLYTADQLRAAVEAHRKRREGSEYLISACYFPDAGEVELSWERKEDGAKATLTAKVSPEQGKQIANVVWPGVYFTAAPQPAEQQPAPDVTALVEALECMIIGACAVAVPHNGERAVLQDAVSIARKAIAAHRKQETRND